MDVFRAALSAAPTEEAQIACIIEAVEDVGAKVKVRSSTYVQGNRSVGRT